MCYTELRIWSEMLEDTMRLRIATSNRIARGADGTETNAVKTVDEAPYLAHLAALERAEHDVVLAMKRCYRKTVDPAIIEWQKTATGIGERLLARLLGVIGHPVQTTRHHWEGDGADRVLVDDGPYTRRVSDLWSYCGHGDATRKRRAGMDKDDAMAMGSPRAKMLTHLLAESCIKQPRSPYRVVYDARREATTDRGWTPGHSHNDALRITAKAILKDLWLAANGVVFEVEELAA